MDLLSFGENNDDKISIERIKPVYQYEASK